MRPITWLHISDFHLRESQEWAQDAVLSAMNDEIRRQRKMGLTVDFVLASGDLAFSGQAAEYALVRSYLEELCSVAGVPQDRVFTIPGNHDVDRGRQTMAFSGARQHLESESQIYAFLSREEERETLLKRLENFQSFQASWSAGQSQVPTADGLGYVSSFEIEEVRFAVVALNSAWLADGDIGDHGKLLIGEGQTRDALRLAKKQEPHVIVAMGHHPLHLLQEFDRAPVQRCLEVDSQFYHCGHLHEPGTGSVAQNGTGCLSLAAGASFESRESHNAFSIVTLDVLAASRTVTFVRYNPHEGEFSYQSKSEYLLEIAAERPCSIAELGEAIAEFAPTAISPFYLAALLLDMKAEVPVTDGSKFVFGTIDVLNDQPDGELKVKCQAFFRVKNVLKLFSRSSNTIEIIKTHGEAVREYGEIIEKCCVADSTLRTKLQERENDARALARVEPVRPFEHTLALLDELKAQSDWEALQENAERLIISPVSEVAVKARRALALCLGRSSQRADLERAVDLLRQLQTEDRAEAEDIGMLATILIATLDYPTAKDVVLDGISNFPDSADGFVSIGKKIVEATGDRAFRDALVAARTERKAL